jgi:hypothetical protein
MAESEPQIAMGNKYRDIVRKHSKAKGSRRSVLNVLANYADDSGEAWPGNETIATEAGISTRTVSRCLDELCASGEIEVVEGGLGRANAYKWRILVSEKGDKKVTDCQVLEPVKGDKKVTTVHIKGDKLTSPIYKELEPYIQPHVISSADTEGAPVATEQQQMFGKICDIVGWDYKTLSRDSQGQIAQTLGILKDAGYGMGELNRFGAEVWVKDWRWIKFKQRPTLTQLREEIGKLKKSNFVGEVAKAASDTYDSPRKRMRMLA